MAAAAPTTTHMHYQKCTLGVAFGDALREMYDANELNESDALLAMSQFDKSMKSNISSLTTTGQLSSGLQTYRLCNDVWQFILDKPIIKLSSSRQKISTQLCTIVATQTKENNNNSDNSKNSKS